MEIGIFEGMNLTEEALQEENSDILRRYRGLLRAASKHISHPADKKTIRKAFNLALDAHKDMRRKSGEPYIYHPIAVARIVAEEIGLGATGVVAALLHDTVEDTDLTLDDMERLFGKKVRNIIDGLTKIEGVFDFTESIQAENFKKIILTLSEDVRVILIKIADRLHNMRTLDHMRRDKQLKIASETMYLYAPLAHRLGLFNIKSELEDLALRYLEPDVYGEIEQKLQKSKEVRDRFISSFIGPIRRNLQAGGLRFEIKGRTKSMYSIWNKIKNKGVPFDEIYDIFAIRIILDVEPEKEKSEIWRTYSIITDVYQPKPDRLRDWISFPRANGYESLHTTVMSPTGKWVEVQIRSRRMDEVAEKGYAAHWKYKGENGESGLDEWLLKVRELLDNFREGEALDLLDSFKLNLFNDEIYLFTPKGELRTLPLGSTALDFAYEIHSELGDHCLGAKVNNKLLPLSHKLTSGDQVEIISSSKQKPHEDWLNFVVTSKAKSRIKSALKEEKRSVAEEGKELLKRKLRRLKINYSESDIQKMIQHFGLDESLDLFYRIGKGSISSQQIRDFYKNEGVRSWYKYLSQKFSRNPEIKKRTAEGGKEILHKIKQEENQLLLGDNLDSLDYKLAPCCNPIPGDEVFGFVTVSEGIKIHKTNCPNAVSLLSNYAYRVIKAKWTGSEIPAFLVGIYLTGFDEVGMVNRITKLISNQMKVNIRSLSFDSNDGIFEGRMTLFVEHTRHLDELLEKIKQVKGVLRVERITENTSNT
jgi:guanosine-3',5'-bis(diphosphate) 3'-pyrophosphohydrolase